jgi:CheY-like chemotaxis protein/two-component sensor histidine kinase
MLAYAGRGRFVVAPLDLSALVSGSATLLHSFVSKKATLRLDLAPHLPAVVADAAQVRQILMNLVINASEALDDREGTIVVETGVMHADASFLTAAHSFAELSPGSYVFLEVRDNGCGMTAEVQGRIFDPFFSTKFTGRGLGLAAVLGIVRAHSGALRVLSEPGQGTTFRLLLRPSDAPVSERMAETSTPERLGASVVLVVDDENAVRLLTSRILKAAGFEVMEAADGKAAVEMYSRDPARVQLVLLDLMMPHLDGEEALREMRRVRADVRAILMSGFSEQELTQRFADAPPAGYLQKPFAREQLLALVARVLEP